MLVLLSAYNGALLVGSCMLCHDAHCMGYRQRVHKHLQKAVWDTEKEQESEGEKRGNKQCLISGPIHLQDRKWIITRVIVLFFPVYTTPCTREYHITLIRCLAKLVAWQQLQHGECCTYSTMMRPQNYTCELIHMCKLLHTRNSIMLHLNYHMIMSTKVYYGDVTWFTESWQWILNRLQLLTSES